jgi:hypothetical protein
MSYIHHSIDDEIFCSDRNHQAGRTRAPDTPHSHILACTQAEDSKIFIKKFFSKFGGFPQFHPLVYHHYYTSVTTILAIVEVKSPPNRHLPILKWINRTETNLSGFKFTGVCGLMGINPCSRKY